jgi:hypothetical protein
MSSGAIAPASEPAAASASNPALSPGASISAPRPAEARVVETVEKDHSNAWLWLVGAGTIAVVLVLFGPQLFGGSPPPPPPEPVVVAEVDDSTPPEPPTPIDLRIPVKVENAVDPLVIAGRADLALAEGRICEPPGECLRDYLAALKELDPNHEAIERLTKKMPASAIETGKKAIADKRFSDANQIYRCVLALAPETAGVKELLAESLVGEGKILRLMKAWDELLPLLDERDKLGVAPSFDALVLKGQAMAGKNRWPEAVEAYQAATKMKPKDKDVAKALEDAKKAAKADAKAEGKK